MIGEIEKGISITTISSLRPGKRNRAMAHAAAMPKAMLTGTTIKALTKAALLSLEVEVPPMSKQHQIAELDQTTQEIVAIRHRLNEIDQTEIAHVTRQALRMGVTHA